MTVTGCVGPQTSAQTLRSRASPAAVCTATGRALLRIETISDPFSFFVLWCAANRSYGNDFLLLRPRASAPKSSRDALQLARVLLCTIRFDGGMRVTELESEQTLELQAFPDPREQSAEAAAKSEDPYISLLG